MAMAPLISAMQELPTCSLDEARHRQQHRQTSVLLGKGDESALHACGNTLRRKALANHETHVSGR